MMERLTKLTDEQLMQKVFSSEPMTPEETMDAINFTGYSRTFESDWKVVKEKPPRPNYHLIAMETAAKLPNKNISELISNAEKIEGWLLEPERLADERHRSLMELLKK